MRSSIFLRLLPTLVVGLTFLFSETASAPSPSSLSTLVSTGRGHLNKLAKRKWTFLGFNQPFQGSADATMIPPWYILYNMVCR